MDLRLYAVVDREYMKNTDINLMLTQALKGGATLIQLRDKISTSRDFWLQAKVVKDICQKYSVPLVINDRIDIALAVDAEGIHLGQQDLPVPIARSLLGPGKIIGLSVKTLEEAIRGQQQGADYVSISPVFRTGTKEDAGQPAGVQTLGQVVKSLDIPVICIGGINESNAGMVMATGCDGIAVISAIFGKENPEAAAAGLLELVDKHKRRIT